MAFTEEKVYSFHEYMERLEEIGNQSILKPNTPPVLWARGHRISDWNLYPTLFRNVKLDPILGRNSGSGRAVEEEVRRQNYIAKNYHFFQKDPENDLEWKEVMQHHGVKTRMLDWSESMLHPLIFALECFFNEKEFRTNERLQSSPCVWVLQPVEWNREALLFQRTN